MKIEKKHKAGFHLKDIFLNTSSFNRGQSKEIEEFSLKLERGYQNEDNLNVFLSISLQSKKDETFRLETSMTGVFELGLETNLSVDNFAKHNAAAIIYPYIREHVRWLSLQANFSSAILLPVINFYSLDKK